MEFLKCFVDERFINKAQFDAGFAHGLILKDGAVPAIKDPAHDSELQMVSETASNVCVLLAIGARARHSLAPPMTCLHSLAPPTTRLHSLAPPTRHASRSSAFSERIVNLYLSFINMIKLKTFWRYEGCSTTL